jgi:hypothetical protein
MSRRILISNDVSSKSMSIRTITKAPTDYDLQKSHEVYVQDMI